MSGTELIALRTLPAHIAPVEYAVAAERYLASANLSQASRRIYRISLTSWCWPLVGQSAPAGRLRRGAVPPVVPLAVLDDPGTGARLAAALAERASQSDARTVNRELSALRSAVGWWQDQGWISADPTAGLRHAWPAIRALPALTSEQLNALWRSNALLREHAFWRLLYDSAAPAQAVLGLDATDLDLDRRRVKVAGPQAAVRWSAGTSDLLGWLLACRQPRARVPDRPPRARPGRPARHLPADRPRADVLPAGGRDLHRAHRRARPGWAGLDAAPIAQHVEPRCAAGADRVRGQAAAPACRPRSGTEPGSWREVGWWINGREPGGRAMAFVQVIEFKAGNVDALRRAGDEWEHATEGKRTARRQVLGRDRDDPDRYYMMVFFDSYESAMVNSELPETQAIAKTFAEMTDTPPVFHDLEIVDDRS